MTCEHCGNIFNDEDEFVAHKMDCSLNPYNNEDLSEFDVSPWQFQIAWFAPRDYDSCGLPNCERESVASWIEQTVVSEQEEYGLIVPLCIMHAHFAAECLTDIRQVVGVSGAKWTSE